MRYYTALLCALLLAGPLSLAGCGGSTATPPPSGDPAEPVFAATLFSAPTAMSNPYFPLPIGQARIFQSETEDGMETVVEEVLDTTRVVAGVECVAVRVREWLGELLLEDSEDWYAQDDAGNVWYMGETVINYEYDDEDNLVDTNSDGSWEAGADVAGVGSNAIAGIIMKADLVVGDSYSQETYAGEAEDMGAIVALSEPVVLACGTAYTCLKTRDWNPLETDSTEFKYYAPGVGIVMTEDAAGDERVELRGRFNNTDASLPDFGAATFSNPTQVDHTFLPLVTETARGFAVEDPEEPERVLVEVLDTTRTVLGVECVVVRDRVFLDDVLIEDTHDWYAQDDAGNVWYMGEEVINYEYDDEGNLIGTDSEGAWEAGVDGAEPGFLMPASPTPQVSYRQEFYEDEAEDMAMPVATNVTYTTGCGITYTGCLKVLEWSPLDPSVVEHKIYAPGLGVVAELPLDGETNPIEFLGAFDLTLDSLPDFGAAVFSAPTLIDNTFMPWLPGQVGTFESDTEDGLEEILVEVLPGSRTVNGVACVEVRDRVYIEGVLIEDTLDWYAQDDAGNVWYMGEDVVNYEYDDEGTLLGTDNDGSWEAGVDGAEAGIVMWASPTPGPSYRQEFYEDEAEDMGVVVKTGVTIVLGDGTTYTGCVKTLDWTPLEPAGFEFKTYAPGVGVVLEEKPGTGERVERVQP